MHGIRNLSQIVLCVGPFRKNVQEEKNEPWLAQKGDIALPNLDKKTPKQKKNKITPPKSMHYHASSKSMKFGQHIKETETFYKNSKSKKRPWKLVYLSNGGLATVTTKRKK